MSHFIALNRPPPPVIMGPCLQVFTTGYALFWSGTAPDTMEPFALPNFFIVPTKWGTLGVPYPSPYYSPPLGAIFGPVGIIIRDIFLYEKVLTVYWLVLR